MIQYLYIASGSILDKKYTELIGVVSNDQQRVTESDPGS